MIEATRWHAIRSTKHETILDVIFARRMEKIIHTFQCDVCFAPNYGQASKWCASHRRWLMICPWLTESPIEQSNIRWWTRDHFINYSLSFQMSRTLEQSPNACIDKKVLDRYLDLELPPNKCQATYIWIDGTGENVRCKDRTLDEIPQTVAGELMITQERVLELNLEYQSNELIAFQNKKYRVTLTFESVTNSTEIMTISVHMGVTELRTDSAYLHSGIASVLSCVRLFLDVNNCFDFIEMANRYRRKWINWNFPKPNHWGSFHERSNGKLPFKNKPPEMTDEWNKECELDAASSVLHRCFVLCLPENFMNIAARRQFYVVLRAKTNNCGDTLPPRMRRLLIEKMHFLDFRRNCAFHWSDSFPNQMCELLIKNGWKCHADGHHRTFMDSLKRMASWDMMGFSHGIEWKWTNKWIHKTLTMTEINKR